MTINQSMPAPQPSAAAGSNQSMPDKPGMNDEEVTIVRDEYAGKYNVSTLNNLAHMYWRLGAFDFDDEDAITNYIKISDCKIYTDYLNDDLEWKQIVSVMGQYLKKNVNSFPLNFQFVLPIHLGRYDPIKKGFPITEKTAFKDAKRIEVDSIDRGKEVCHDEKAIKDYPKALIILLPGMFTLDFLNMDEHVAQAFIIRKKEEFNKLDDAQKVSTYERQAYLRLRVTFSQYHGNLRSDDNDAMAILYGTIDGYEIFEDATQKRLMASVDLSKIRKDAPQMSMPGTAPSAPIGKPQEPPKFQVQEEQAPPASQAR